ncbi:hypothetical protein [Nocardioides terrisoli]|nr:hypothetical protein [Nocardioides marmorisolisilvae]
MAEVSARETLRRTLLRRLTAATTTLRRTAASWLTSGPRSRDAGKRTR